MVEHRHCAPDDLYHPSTPLTGTAWRGDEARLPVALVWVPHSLLWDPSLCENGWVTHSLLWDLSTVNATEELKEGHTRSHVI